MWKKREKHFMINTHTVILLISYKDEMPHPTETNFLSSLKNVMHPKYVPKVVASKLTGLTLLNEPNFDSVSWSWCYGENHSRNWCL